MLTGDIGRMAELARDDRLGDASLALFHPIKFMLASPAEDAAEIVRRLGVPVWVEDKYDGIRAQLHRHGRDVRLYSRDLHEIGSQFPEVVDGARDLGWDGILDGEILGLARRHRPAVHRPPGAARAEGAVGGDPGRGAGDLRRVRRPRARAGRRRRPPHGRDAPDRSRRSCASRSRTGAGGSRRCDLPLAGDGGVFALSHLASVTSVDGLEDAFRSARERRNEGLMVKDPRSIYSPGRRGLGWLKMKKALATIDCVVVGVEVGHGKRHGVLSDYTFAVRDTENERLVTIGKAYSGLTDAEIAEMTRWFEDHTIARFGRYRQVEPTVVVEVAFDVIVRSSRHQSGYSLRFPRIANLRPGQDARRDRHARDGRRAVRGPPAGRRAAGDGGRQEVAAIGRVAPVESDRSTRVRRPRILRPCSTLIGGEPPSLPLTLYTDSFVIKGQIRTRQARITDILNQADEDFLVLRDAVIDEYGIAGRSRRGPSTPRSTSARSCSRSPTRRSRRGPTCGRPRSPSRR